MKKMEEMKSKNSLAKYMKVVVGIAVVTAVFMLGAKDVKAADPDYFYVRLVELDTGNTEAIINASGLNLQYSYDKSDWKTDSMDNIKINQDKPIVYFRAEYNQDKVPCNFDSFKFNGGKVEVGGDIMYLLSPNRTQEMGTQGFNSLFWQCYQLVNAEKLKLPDYVKDECYVDMFQQCDSLKKAPVLPATSLATKCYKEMFEGCSSLTELHVKFTSVDEGDTEDEGRLGKWLEGVPDNFTLYGPASLAAYADKLGLPTNGGKFIEEGSKQDEPASTRKAKREKKSSGLSYYEYLAMLAANKKNNDSDAAFKSSEAVIDKDTFKSEAPAQTVMATDTTGADKFLDLKVHSADENTTANQKFLAQNLVASNAQILLTENTYTRRDLSTSENGSLQTLTWNNLPKNQAGPVYAVVYNQIDGAYVVSGTLDANGTAIFAGFKLRPASTITICK